MRGEIGLLAVQGKARVIKSQVADLMVPVTQYQAFFITVLMDGRTVGMTMYQGVDPMLLKQGFDRLRIHIRDHLVAALGVFPAGLPGLLGKLNAFCNGHTEELLLPVGVTKLFSDLLIGNVIGAFSIAMDQ